MLNSPLLAEGAPPQLHDKLSQLNHPEALAILSRIARGIEKEGLRATANGKLATTPHPTALGSALTNSWVTTDFSESLLEFITPVQHSIRAAIESLTDMHAVAALNIGDEVIWSASMPCVLPNDSEIPLAQYGKSNSALMKTAYRRGLGHRYGRAMQTVAGIHYNFSLPAEYWQLEASAQVRVVDQHYINNRYFDLIRNFRRYYWLLIYLFGAAPCADASFVQNREHNLQTLPSGDLYLPDATSLRMGDMGYQSVAQQSLFICYNELDTYIKTLTQAMQIPYPPYEQYGLVKNGVYQQLSTALLQIENEFYSPVRPKRVTHPGEKPLAALADRGIEYIEVRCPDIDPFASLGIDESTIHFLDSFLLSCLLMESPACNQREFSQISSNQARVVNRGRETGLQIFNYGQQVDLQDCALQLLDTMLQVARILDNAHQTNAYTLSVDQQKEKVLKPELTPSARLLNHLKNGQLNYIDYISGLSRQYMDIHRNRVFEHGQDKKLFQIARESLQKQIEIEQNDPLGFDEFLQRYFSDQS